MLAPGRGLIAVVVAAVAALSSSPLAALAQGASDAARDAFTAGLAAESAGRAEEACRSFRKSLALVRELGPLQKSAACDEREGKLRSASALLEELLARLPAEDPERQVVEERLRAARGDLGLVTIVVRPGAPAGLRARFDGEPIALPAKDVMADPGRRELVVELPEGGAQVTDVEVPAGGRVTITIPQGEGERPPPSPPPLPPPAASEPDHPLRTPGWILGGVGLAGFVGVVATGIPLIGKSSDFDACGSTDCENEISDSASGLVAVNTVMWAVGIAGVGLGATFLILDASSSDDAEVSASVSPGAAVLRGRF